MTIHPRIGTVLIACLLIAGVGGAVEPADLAGLWAGEVEIPGSPLEVRVELAAGPDRLSGTISIPAQNADGLTLDAVSLAGRKLTFAIEGVPGEPTFTGALSDDGETVEGTFTQGGAAFPFHLERADDPAEAGRSALEGLRPVVQQALDDFDVPSIAIAVVVDGETVLTQGYGMRNIEEEYPATADTLYAIGSSTKAFTSLAIGVLVDQGLVEWDTPVMDVLPVFRLADDHASLHLTVRDLLTHRSGLPRHDMVWYNADSERRDLLHRLRYLEPFRDLRQEWSYQNLMYLTAGLVVEELTGESWEDAVSRLLLEPLGMLRTNCSVMVSQRDPDHATPYREQDGELESIPFRAIDTIGPAGSINSSAADMARWLELQLGGGRVRDTRVVSPVVLRATHTPQMALQRYPEKNDVLLMSYGLGWFLHAYRGHYQVEHGGNIDGFSALVTVMPLDGVGVVVLSNADATPLPELLTRHILDRVLDLEPRPWLSEALERRKTARREQQEGEARKAELRITGTSPAHALEDYAGRYENPGYGLVTVSLDGQRLIIELHGLSAPLEHWHYEVFNALRNPDDPALEDQKVRFRTSVRGSVDALIAALEPRVDPIVFARMPDARLRDPSYLQRFAGAYELTGETLRVDLEGDTLVLSVPGQPPYDLKPSQGTEFQLEAVSSVSVRFVLDESGAVTTLELLQPNGIFTAERVED